MGKPKRLKSVDLRGSWSRRHAELVEAYGRDFGASLSTADAALTQTIATVTVEIERLKAVQLAGQSIDSNELVRLGNCLARLRRELSAKADTTKRPPTLEEWLNDEAA